MSDVPDDQRWNHNIRYQRELFQTIPPRARTALDVGCGEGFAARALAHRGLEVTGVDLDSASIERAGKQDCHGVTYLCGDAFSLQLPHDTFDVVTATAVLHHMDLHAAMANLSRLVTPGGQLLVVGLAHTSMPRDAFREVLAWVFDKVDRARHGAWEHGSPTAWPPPHSFDEVRKASREILPGCTYARKVLWRYTIEWTKPAGKT